MPDFDALLMWGSWFHPFANTKFQGRPFFHYVDQSCAKDTDPLDAQEFGLEAERKKFNASQTITYRDCKTVFCFSDWARRLTIENHPVESDKVVKAGWGPIGINLLHETFETPDSPLSVLFVGHQFQRKGVDILRAAVPLVVKEVPDVTFKIVGSNVDNLKVDPHPNVEMLGAIADMEKLKGLYKTASVFVLPHRFERAGHVLVEAMSCGLPIITSNQGGAVEAVKHGVSGFIIPVGDVEALAKYLILLLKDKQLRKAFGAEAKKIMAQEYTMEVVAGKMVDVMESRV
jgi:glycosyltransferase involved in cell wall biosynthesis